VLKIDKECLIVLKCVKVSLIILRFVKVYQKLQYYLNKQFVVLACGLSKFSLICQKKFISDFRKPLMKLLLADIKSVT